jgi:hypothetical protein
LLAVDKGDPANARVHIYLAPSAQQIDVTEQFTPDALAAVSTNGARLVLAAEPGYSLTTNDLSAVMLQPDGFIPATLTTDFRTGRVDVGGTGSDPPSLDQPPDNAAVTLGGRRETVYAAATIIDSSAHHHHHRYCRGRHTDENGNDEEEIWSDLAISPGWNLVPIVNPMRGEVLGITVAGSTATAAYVLDKVQDHGSWLRIYRFTDAGDVSELVRWPADEYGQTTSLSTSFDGGLLVTTSSSSQHAFVHFELDANEKVVRVTSLEEHGMVAVSPRAVRGGIAWGKATDSEHVAPMRTDGSNFHPVFRTCESLTGESTAVYSPQTAIDFVGRPAEPTRFSAPSSLSVVRGNAGNHSATVTFSNGLKDVVCTYRGGASVPHPTTSSDLNNGLQYHLVRCNCADQNEIEADQVRVHVEGDPLAGSTSVRATIDEKGDAHPDTHFGSLNSACH